jgi:WXG100 family type VII secretion target
VSQSVDVVVSDLHAASARLADVAQRLRDGLSGVDDETNRLLGSGWKGGAASAFGTAWTQWHGGAAQVVQALQRMSELLELTGKEYAKTDEQSAGALGSSMQGSGGAAGSAGVAGSGSSGGGATDGGGDSADLAQQMNMSQPSSAPSELGQLVSPLLQAGQALAGLPQQVGQLAAGLAQQGVQLATGLTQQAGQEKPADGGTPTTDDSQRDDERAGEPEPAAGGAPSGTAPISSTPVGRGEQSGSVERPWR